MKWTTEYRKEYDRAYSKKRAKSGKKQADLARLRNRNKKHIKAYLKNHPCVDCGETDIIVLQFDHVRGKKRGNVSDMVNNCSIETLDIEISKCKVRCANRHTRKTKKRLIRV